MKVLVVGAGGMIGHMMFRKLSPKFQVSGTLRQPRSHYAKFPLFTKENSFDNTDVLDQKKMVDLLNQYRPDVILNCVGITLRKPEIKDLNYSQKVNAEFPHFLNSWAVKSNSYLIHFSTDCVFSGKDGPYTEESPPSATDTYGTTKAGGEVVGSHALTLRGSMIGRELFGKTELLEWAISQKNKKVRGFTKAVYSGVTTNVMSDLVANLISRPEKLTGLYQVSSVPITKFELLKLIDQYFHLNMQIEESSDYSTSKILISEKIKEKIGFICPPWRPMIEELALDSFNYE